MPVFGRVNKYITGGYTFMKMKNCSSCISFHNGIRNDQLVALQEQAIPQAQEAMRQQTTQQQMTVQKMQTLQKEVLMMKTH